MPNENDNKLVTLADLAEAYNALYNRDVMTSADKTKLDGIESGAQVNTITGVKGNAEASYRTGNVNLAPANIGAAADSAAMQFRGFYPNGQSMLSLTPGYYQTSDYNLPSETFPNGINVYGTLCVDSSDYKHITYISVIGDIMIWKSYSNSSESITAAWYVVQHEGIVPVSSGGTGVTQGTTDITSQCVFNVSTYPGSYVYYNPYLKLVFGVLTVYTGVNNVANQQTIVTLPASIFSNIPQELRSVGIGTTSTPNVSLDVTLDGRNLVSSHSINMAVSEPRYLIQGYIG